MHSFYINKLNLSVSQEKIDDPQKGLTEDKGVFTVTREE
jgi:hypothetical protein